MSFWPTTLLGYLGLIAVTLLILVLYRVNKLAKIFIARLENPPAEEDSSDEDEEPWKRAYRDN